MVRAARAALSGVALRTPLIASRCLDEVAGQPVFLNLETRQPDGAFKLNALALLGEADRQRGVVCCSACAAASGTIFKD